MVETQECCGPVHLGAPLQTGQVWGSQEWDNDCTCAKMKASLKCILIWLLGAVSFGAKVKAFEWSRCGNLEKVPFLNPDREWDFCNLGHAT